MPKMSGGTSFGGWPQRSPSKNRSARRSERPGKDFVKKFLFPVDDDRARAIFAIPPEAGLETFRGGSRKFWDCKLELNFVPA
jgi:hypothetical protein